MTTIPTSHEILRTVGVVVCTYKMERIPLLQAAIKSLGEQTHPIEEIIVVADGTCQFGAYVQDVVRPIRVLSTRRRLGLSNARNLGASVLQTDVLLFLDDDAEADPEWARMLLGPLGNGVIGSSGRSLPAWEAARPWWLPDEFLWAFGCTYRGAPTTLTFVRNVIGGCTAMLRPYFTEAGGYDRTLGYGPGSVGGGEEAELCLRMRRLWPESRFVYEPAAVISHFVPSDRLKWGYFIRRCFAEGKAKHRVARLSGGVGVLRPELEFVKVFGRRAGPEDWAPPGSGEGHTASRQRAQRRGRLQIIGFFAGSVATITGYFAATVECALARARSVMSIKPDRTRLLIVPEPTPVSRRRDEGDVR